MKKILSIYTEDERIVFNFFGIKIKIKSKNLIAKTKYPDLLKSANYFSNQVNIDSNIINQIEYNYLNKPTHKNYTKDLNKLQAEYNTKIQPNKLRIANSILRNHQLRILQLAKDVKSQLENNNITFSLSAGSLIGAMRHKGFIPWDDDIDFDIIRDENDVMEKFVKGELGHNNFKFLDLSECKSYIEFWQLINKEMNANPNEIIFCNLKGYLQCYSGTSIADHIVIDFFPWEFLSAGTTPEKYIRWKKKFDKIYNNSKLTWGEIEQIYKNELNSNKIFTTRDKAEKVITMYGLPHAFIHNDYSKLFNANMFLSMKKSEFEDTEFYVPNNTDEYLTTEYGAWMTIPPDTTMCKHLINIQNFCPEYINKKYYIDYNEICEQEGYVWDFSKIK